MGAKSTLSTLRNSQSKHTLRKNHHPYVVSFFLVDATPCRCSCHIVARPTAPICDFIGAPIVRLPAPWTGVWQHPVVFQENGSLGGCRERFEHDSHVHHYCCEYMHVLKTELLVPFSSSRTYPPQVWYVQNPELNLPSVSHITCVRSQWMWKSMLEIQQAIFPCLPFPCTVLLFTSSLSIVTTEQTPSTPNGTHSTIRGLSTHT